MGRNPQQFLEAPTPLPANLSFVLDISPSAMTLGLANIRSLLDSLHRPEKCFSSVVVAGTNGKGSVTAYLASLLSANGRRVGRFSSPHIYDVNERICIDGYPVSVEEMEEAARRIVPLYDDIGYSYFEALTAIALLIFADRGVEIAVLETGLGGRFDATNAVDPEISVLTSISLDHRRILGDTEEEILREKLGIARPGRPLLCGPLPPALASIAGEKSQREGIERVLFDALGSIDLRSMSFDGMAAHVCTPSCDYGIVPLPFLGTHQLANALLSIGAAERMIGKLDGFDRAARGARLPGRFEVVRCGDKHVVFDVAHNDAALLATTTTLAALSPRERNAMVLGMLRRKEIKRFPERMAQHVGRLYLVDPLPGETVTPGVLLNRIGLANTRDSRMDVVLEPPFESGTSRRRFVERLMSPANPCDTVLMSGSHRTVEAFGRDFREMGLA